ncbi:autotransporter-associated beta strand repeat-containing protein, partial [Burkholderia pseudomallei]
MNAVYRIVWSVVNQGYVVVSELARSSGKKSQTRAGCGAVLLLPFAALVTFGQAQAATVTWSPTGVNSSGSGNWDLTTKEWYNGTQVLPWTSGDSALFNGTPGTVNVLAPITVQDLLFGTTGYTIQGGTLNTNSATMSINVGSGNTATINSIIAGNGRVGMSGAGTVTLGGINTYSGGTLITGGSTLNVSADSNLGVATGVLTLGDTTTSGTLAITGNAFQTTRAVTLGQGGGTINAAPGVTATLGGVMGGSGAFNFTGNGTLVLTGANTYSGATTIASGTLQVGNGGTSGTLGTGTTLTNNGKLVFNLGNSYTYAGTISGTGSLEQKGIGGTTILTGNNTYSGGTTIDTGSTLQLGAGGATGSVTGPVTNSGLLSFNNSGLTFGGVISGTGSVQQTGGTTTMTGANTYMGDTLMRGGVLQVANDGNLGASTSNLHFTGNSNFHATNAFTTARNIAIDSGINGYVGTTNVGNILTLNGIVSGAGAFGVDGGQVSLTGNNTYTGGTNIYGGYLDVLSDANLGSANTGINFVNTGTLRLLSSFASTRNIAITGANATLDAFNGSTFTANGKITGGGFLNLTTAGTGGGTVVLNGTNSYSGGTGLTGGVTAVVSADANLGNGGAVSFNGGTLATKASFATNRSMLIGSGANIIDVAPTTTLTLNGTFGGGYGGSFQKNNTGTLVLAGTNTSNGTTAINAGTLQIGNGGSTGGLGTGNVVNNSALVFNLGSATTYGGVLSGSGTLTLNGPGTTTLTGNNSYSGATLVNAGALYVNGTQTSTAIGTTTVASGATLGGNGTISGNVVVNNGGTLGPGSALGTAGTLNIRGGLSLSSGSILNYDLGQPGTVGGTYNDLLTVGGPLTLAGTLNVSATTGGAYGPGVYRIISYTGALTNNGLSLGTLPAGTSSTLQTSTPGQVNLITNLTNTRFWDGAGNPNNNVVDGGTGVWNTGTGANNNWTDSGGVANAPYTPGFAVFESTPGLVTVDNTGGQVVAAGLQFAVNGYRITGAPVSLAETTAGSGISLIRVGDGTAAGSGYTATIDSVLQGTGVGVTKADLGKLVLTGANTYTGGTTISAGALQLGNGGTSGSIVGNVVDNGTLIFNRSDNAGTVSGVISGTGGIQQIGTGTTTLTGANTYSGTTAVSSGILQVGNGGTTGSLGTGATTLSSPGTLAFNFSAPTTYTYGGVISGTGSLLQNGAGTTTLTGANTYSGGTTISAGTLALGSGGSIVGNVVDNGTLFFANNTNNITFGGAISGTGSVRVDQAGSVTLTGNNTFTGGMLFTDTVNHAQGRVYFSSDANLGASTGTLTFTGSNLIPWLVATSSATSNRNIVINSGAQASLANSVSGAVWTLAGNISGAGLVGIRGGTIQLTGNNTYSGGTYINGANLLVQTDASLGAATGGIAMDNGATLQALTSFSSSRNINTTNTGGTILTTNGSTLTLGGAIGGNGGLTYGNVGTGNGTVVITGNDAHGGGDFISNGVTLQVGNGGTTGAVTGGIVNNGTLAFNRSNSYTSGNVISGTGAVQQNGTGTTVLSNANTYTGGTTINAGTLQLGAGGATGSIVGDITNNSNLAFNLNSSASPYAGVISGTGALQSLGVLTVLTGINTYTGGTTINVGSTLQIGNGGTSGSIVGNVVDSGTLSFNRSDASTFSGTISGTGGLLQNGGANSITTLTGNNAYTGATTVSSGALYVNGNQTAATSGTTVAAGAVLGGTGTIGGNVIVANDGILAPGSANGAGGTLTIGGNLTLNSTSISRYTFGSINGQPANSLTNVNGNLTLDGRLDVTVPTGGSFDPGVYRVFNYGGTLTNNGFVLGNMPPNTTVSLQTGVPNQINLINSTGVLSIDWDGNDPTKYNNGVADGGNGTWSRQPTNTSWTDSLTALSNASYTPNAFAIFQGTPGTVSVDTSYGAIDSSGMQFAVDGYKINGGAINLVETKSGTGSTILRVGDNSAAGVGYTATVGSVLTGSTQLTKTDLGKLVLTGANTYSGGTAINGGMLSVANDGNLGAATGGLSFDGGTLEATGTFTTARGTTLTAKGGTIDVDAGQTLTMNGAIGGAGALTKTDAGTLVLNNANTYGGGTIIGAGTLQVGNGGTTGSLSGDVANNGLLAFDRSDNVTYGGVVSGSGALTQQGAGTLVLTGTNTYSGGTAINAGKVQVSSDANLGAAAGPLSLDGGILETTASLTSGRATTLNAGGGTLDVDGGTTLTMNGRIRGPGSLTKTDAGTLVLNGANFYTGGTTISDGELRLTDAGGVGSGT